MSTVVAHLGVNQAEALSGSLLLIHGLARSSRSMRKLEHFANAHALPVLNIDYPSRKLPPRQLINSYIRPALHSARAQGEPLHVVTHSLGGILLRAAIGAESPAWLGRVVMLCPPNQGSEIIDRLRHWSIPRRWIGPTGLQLGTDPNSLPMTLPPIPFDCGVIAADRSIDPILGPLLHRPHDGKVCVSATRAAGVRDHALVHTNHATAASNAQVIELTWRYLCTGSFCPAAQHAASA